MKTVHYGDHAEQLIDVWTPAGSDSRPAAVLIHGGYWRQKYDRSYLVPLAEHLAARGTAVALIEFRRVRGAGGWPHTFDDIATAVDMLPELLGSKRIVLVGHSAGGHLALWAAGRHRLPAGSRWRRDTPSAATKVVALAPVCDLRRADELRLSDHAVAELLGGPDLVARRLPDADPMGLLPLGVPVTVIHGDADVHVPLELSERFAAAAGDEVTLIVLPGVDHFEPTEPDSPICAETVRAIDVP